MIIVFLIGYLCIALEHPLKINKAGTALLIGSILWVLYTFASPELLPVISGEAFKEYLALNPSLANQSLFDQCAHFIVSHQIPEVLGEICGTLIFLIGAMIIVELIDAHGGFMFITGHIKTNQKRKLLALIAFMTFFMSAVLDNLTTSIVMIMLIRKLIGNQEERWIFGSIIIIAANSGGAWSPIGDVTTIMLWVKGNISTAETIPNLLLPSIVSAVIPTMIAMRYLDGTVVPPAKASEEENNELLAHMARKDKLNILILGVMCLIFVPIFKSITHLPPFLGILLGVGILWIYTEMLYKRDFVSENLKLRVSKIAHRIDSATLLFFLGILLAVDALRCAGILTDFAIWLDQAVGNVYAVNLIIGALSAVVDNVPLVAGAIGMYPIADAAMIASAADPAYMAYFAMDGTFWQFLAYCAGVGGSMLIIGSAAGVVVMGLEGINFIWYLKRISWLAMLGYLAGAGIYVLQQLIF